MSVSPGLSASLSRRVIDPGQIELPQEIFSGTHHLSPTGKSRVMLHAWALQRQNPLDTPITSEGTCILAPGQSWHCPATSPRWSCSIWHILANKGACKPRTTIPAHGRVETFRKGPSSALCLETGPDSRGGGAGTLKRDYCVLRLVATSTSVPPFPSQSRHQGPCRMFGLFLRPGPCSGRPWRWMKGNPWTGLLPRRRGLPGGNTAVSWSAILLIGNISKFSQAALPEAM